MAIAQESRSSTVKDAHRHGCVISFIPLGVNLTMEQHEQERFEQLYAQHLQALKLQGKRGKTIDGYARAVRRIAGYFNRCPDNLTAADLKTYFAWMVENYSWSSVKLICGGCRFSSDKSSANLWSGWTSSSHPTPVRCLMYPPGSKCSD